MERDMDLIRALLLKLERMPMSPGIVMMLDPNDDEFAVEDKTADDIDYHFRLVGEAGFVDDVGKGFASGDFRFRRLSWAGHDFLDSVRDADIWNATKQGVDDAKGFTFELLRDLAKGLIKKKIEVHTGVQL
jgi:hypothetical protein